MDQNKSWMIIATISWFDKLVLNRYHPDKNVNNPEASELFKEVAYSYSLLSDPEKRRQYDNSGFEVHFFSPFSYNCFGRFKLW